MESQILSPLKQNLFGKGYVAYNPSGCLEFLIPVFDKQFNITVPLTSNVDSISSIFVQEDESTLILCHSKGILVVDISNLLFHVTRMKETKESIQLPELNILVPGVVSTCCYNPKNRNIVHVLDSAFNLFTYNIESTRNPLVSMWKLLSVVYKDMKEEVILSVPYYMDIVTNTRTHQWTLLIGMKNGVFLTIGDIPWNRLLMQDIFPVANGLSSPKLVSSVTGMEIVGGGILRKVEALEDVVLYCLVSSDSLNFILYYHSDYRISVVDRHWFDCSISKSDVIMNQIEREIQVDSLHISYQWIVDVLAGKGLTERHASNTAQMESSIDWVHDQCIYKCEIELNKAKEMSERVMYNCKESGMLEALTDEQFVNSTLAVLTN